MTWDEKCSHKLQARVTAHATSAGDGKQAVFQGSRWTRAEEERLLPLAQTLTCNACFMTWRVAGDVQPGQYMSTDTNGKDTGRSTGMSCLAKLCSTRSVRLRGWPGSSSTQPVFPMTWLLWCSSSLKKPRAAPTTSELYSSWTPATRNYTTTSIAAGACDNIRQCLSRDQAWMHSLCATKACDVQSVSKAVNAGYAH